MVKLRNKLSEETVLILESSYDDTVMTAAALKLVGVSAYSCLDLKDLCDRLQKNCGAVVVSETVLTADTDQTQCLQTLLKQQETWSDIPIILLTGSDVAQAARLFSSSGNISLLERPFSQLTLIRSVEVALRARRKQYEMRYLSDALKVAKENAEKGSLAKTQFLANMSHEIRTPIGAILGFINLMQNPQNKKDENLKYMRVVERNSQQLLRLIDDILDLTKVEAGKMSVENNQFNFTEWLVEFNSMMSFKASDKGIQFKFILGTTVPDLISTDPIRLRQILTNVVGNAIKFTEHGSVEMSVDFEAPFLRFKVKDTGIGISEDQSKKLFQSFSQADSSTTRKFGGTGLGLVLSKHLAQALGGDLTLEQSTPNEGSTFIVSTKVEIPPQSKMVGENILNLTSNKNEELTEEKLKGLKVLLVEDSPDNQDLVQILLDDTGASITMASDGQQGVENALSEDFDVVLMDIQMPRLDGHGATQALRKLEYGKPIIALTAHALSEERSRCFASGFTDFLTKPIQKDLLVDVLSRYTIPIEPH